VNDELKAVVAHFDEITWYLPGGTEENHDAFRQVANLEAGI
jgi:hypothetical protein